jgi:hypothetical protein
MSGASTPTYETGIIVPGVTAGASAKQLVAKSGCNERPARRNREKNWIGVTGSDDGADSVRNWRIFGDVESTRGAHDRTTPRQCRTQAGNSSACRAPCSESARTPRADISNQAHGEATPHARSRSSERA